MKLSSKSNYYTEKLIKYCFDYKPSVIEIHNRPSYLLKISKFFNETNFILVIHNDPLNLRGSTSVEERTKLLKSCYKIYFVSSWVEEKSFLKVLIKIFILIFKPFIQVLIK